jgi:hypothetical protein
MQVDVHTEELDPQAFQTALKLPPVLLDNVPLDESSPV